MTARTLVLHPEFRRAPSTSRSASASLEEAAGLAQAIAMDIAGAFSIPVTSPRPSTLFGSGQVERYQEYISEHSVEVVVVNTTLTPIQQRNLEKAWKAKVIDRTALILEIFGERARTREGKLQVELASLEYQKSRLVRSWTHLERQRGGFGFLGGPGESQIETDRRLIRDRIAAIRKQLTSVQRTRSLHRKVRRDTPFPLLALVGYTNAGKSTLFNSLTRADTYAANALFATLDPVIRKVKLPSGMTVMLSDTVGFISDLPTQLIAAFRATLEEVLEADLLLHVQDISHPDAEAQRADVETVLKELLDEDADEIERIEVCNKIDQIDPEDFSVPPHILGTGNTVCATSALTGQGIPELLDTIDSLLRNRFKQRRVYRLSLAAGRALAWLHSHGEVFEKHEEGETQIVSVALSPSDISRFEREFGKELAPVP